MTASRIPYADYTNYVPANPPSMVPVNPFTVRDVTHWQPLQYQDVTGTLVTQKFAGAQWGKVTPFALTSANQFRDQISRWRPAISGSPAFLEECHELATMSANLTDRRKMIAEYWADGRKSSSRRVIGTSLRNLSPRGIITTSTVT